MKKTLLSLAIALSSYCSYAQNTYPWPSTGNVGIGTTSPLSGGSTASWLTLNGTSTYSGGTIYSIGGVIKGYSYVDNDGLFTQQAVTGQKFIVNSTATAMTINSSGKVGIGTTTPGLKLEINGTVGAPMTTGSTQTGILRISNPSLVSVLDMGEFGSAPYGAWLQATDYSNLQNTHPLIFNPNGGNIGIGTASPNALLDVLGGNIAVSNNLNVGGDDGNGLKLFGNTSNPPYRSVDIVPFIPASAPGVDHVGLKIYTANGITSRVNAMTVTDAGNVIIGNASQINPVYKLDVYGSARADKIVVNTTGADFVFDKEYTLPKLSYVKAYIEANHHLPEIASAKEMQTNGVELGEMNKKLLQKVEELTLYLIEQQKQIDKLKQQLNTLTKN